MQLFTRSNRPGGFNVRTQWINRFCVSLAVLLCSVTFAKSGVPPSVQITSPSNASVVSAPTVTITAAASDPDGNVLKVEFFRGATKLGEDLTAPYSFVWTNATAGYYQLSALATDNEGASSNYVINVQVIGEGYPNVALNKPVVVSSVENVSLSGSNAVDGNLSTRWASAASDPQYLYVDLQQAYALNRVKITWEAAYGKDYKIQTSNNLTSWSDIKVVSGNTALVNDWNVSGTGRYIRVLGTARGTVYGYSIYELEVYSANASPGVQIYSPRNNQSYQINDSIPLGATALDNDGSITKVEFFHGTTKIGEDLSYPYLIFWKNLSVGTYTVTAVATDNQGAKGTSAPITFSVYQPVQNVPPNVQITSPYNASIVSGPMVTINATASDSDGSVVKVEFFRGTTKLGEDLTAPYSFIWENAAPGYYQISAVATDNQGATNNYVVNIQVIGGGNPNVALNKPVTVSSVESGGTSGSYAVDGNTSTRWASAFSDPQFIYVDLQQVTSLSRVRIVWEAAFGKDYKIQTSNDLLSWSDIKVVTGNTALINDWTVSGSGRYVRVLGTARGTMYGYSIYELEVYSTNVIPGVVVTSPRSGASFTTSDSIPLGANAQDNDGTIAKVEFYNGTTKIGEDLTAPYLTFWKNVPVGTYTITAVATDNQGARGTSAPVTISVYAPSASAKVGEEDAFSADALVSPNPASASIQVAYPGSTDQPVAYQILSINGTWIQTGNLSSGALGTIDVSSLTNGAYLLKVTIDGKVIIKRISIVK